MRILPLGFMALTAALTFASAVHAETERALVCGVTPACDTAPVLGKPTGFLTSNPKGDAWHHGRDLYLTETEDQWVIGKFQYGNYLLRKNLVHEAVEIQVLRDCGKGWETLGKTYTTDKGEHAPVLRYSDEGGMVFFKIPEDKKLGLGRHRVRLVATGDQSSAELFLEVLPPNSTLFVSDVDGTLTTSELIELVASTIHTLPPAHPGASLLLSSLSRKGYHPLYLTARSSNLIQRTRDFLGSKKFPAGIIQTSSAGTFGLSGDKGIAYKTEVLQSYEERGFHIAYAFGNSKVDAGAFANTAIPDSGKFFYKFDKFTDVGGGTKFDDYNDLAEVKAADNLCSQL